MEKLLEGIGIGVRVVVLGELLFLAIIVLYATQSGARVFQYVGF